MQSDQSIADRRVSRLLFWAWGAAGLLTAAFVAAAAFAAPPVAESVAPALRWTEILRAIWPVVVIMSGLIVACVMLGLATRFATLTALAKLEQRVKDAEVAVTGHNGRLALLEDHCATSPTRQELQEDIGELGSRMTGVERTIDGMADQLKTTNTYLHTLIERGLARP